MPKRIRIRRRRAPLLLPVFLSSLCAGCLNPFAPELKKSPDSSLLITEQKNPEQVLQNFKYAYTFKDSLLYANLLDSSFVFVYFDPNADPSGRFVSWGRDVDLRTTARLFRSFNVIDLTWNSTIYSFQEGDAGELSKSFSLNLVGEEVDVKISGNAVFSFRKCPYDSTWRITRWKDESEF